VIEGYFNGVDGLDVERRWMLDYPCGFADGHMFSGVLGKLL
jgi:hypothetical protein